MKNDRPNSGASPEEILRFQREHYESGNPVARWLIGRFERAILDTVGAANPQTLFEVGCGDGHISLFLLRHLRVPVVGGDINPVLVEQANKDAAAMNCAERARFDCLDIFSSPLSAVETDMVLCCEVLEHLDKPDTALERIAAMRAGHFLFTVPSEPFWRLLNLARLKYTAGWGNTPGHLNHWSYWGFRKFLRRRFDVVVMRSCLPWALALCRKRR